MARASRTARHAGLYADLADREERAIALGGTAPGGIPGTSYDATPARLQAFRRGEPVEVPACSLPESARPVGACRWWLRAVVFPDGTVEFVDDPAAWVSENGM